MHEFNQPPTPDSKRGILFSGNTNEPEFTWIAPLRGFGGFTELLGSPRKQQRYLPGNAGLGTLLGDEFPELQFQSISGRALDGRCVQRNLAVVWCDENAGSEPINRTIYALTQWQPLHNQWNGPLVAYGLDDELTGLRDLTPEDLNFVVGFFLAYGKKEGHQSFDPSKFEIRQPEKMVDAVMIACNGEFKYRDKPLFSRVKIPRTHVVFERGKHSDTAACIGQALCSIRSPTPDLGVNYTLNYFGSNLHRPLDIENDSFGIPEKYWWDTNGNVIVARKDQEPLSIQFLKMLCIWCVEELAEHMQQALEESWETPEMDEDASLEAREAAETAWERAARLKMRSKVTKENFDAYESEWMKKTPEQRDKDVKELSEDGRLMSRWLAAIAELEELHLE